MKFSRYSEAWKIPEKITNYTLDGVHYSSSYYTIENETFFCSGFDESISSAYVNFSLNPLLEWSLNDNGNQVKLNITTAIPLTNARVYFTIDNDRISIKNRSVEEYNEIDGTLYFYLDIDLNSGLNELVVNYRNFKNTPMWYLFIPVIGLAGVVYYLFRKQKKKEEDHKNRGKGD